MHPLLLALIVLLLCGLLVRLLIIVSDQAQKDQRARWEYEERERIDEHPRFYGDGALMLARLAAEGPMTGAELTDPRPLCYFEREANKAANERRDSLVKMIVNLEPVQPRNDAADAFLHCAELIKPIREFPLCNDGWAFGYCRRANCPVHKIAGKHPGIWDKDLPDQLNRETFRIMSGAPDDGEFYDYLKRQREPHLTASE